MRLAAYHIRLAWKGIRRDWTLSLAVVVGIAVSGGIWAAAFAHYWAYYGPSEVAPDLHHVTVIRDGRYVRALAEAQRAFTERAPRQRVTFGEYQHLASTGIPSRQTGCARGRVLVGSGISGPVELEPARFVSADFFALFPLVFRYGGPWAREAEAAGDRVVVLGESLNTELFGGADSTGRTIVIEGQRFRVSGVIAGAAPSRPPWDTSVFGLDGDALFVPFAELQRLLARPEMPIHLSRAGTRHDQLLASETLFISFWAGLPTAQHRARFEAALRERFGPGGFEVAAYAEWDGAYPPLLTPISFFAVLALLVVAGSAFNTARLLLAKSTVRAEEFGVYRALGAPASSLFARLLWEAMLLGGAATLLAPLLGQGLITIFNGLVAETRVPLRYTAVPLTATVVVVMVAALVGGLYPAWRASRIKPTLYLGRC